MISEVIISTLNRDGSPHAAPMGIRQEQGLIILAPFKPSTTLENIQYHRNAVVNYIDDVRIFSGFLSGHSDWPLVPAEKINGYRLEAALAHAELELTTFEDHELRPRFYCRTLHQEAHKPFAGFNRAQGAVLEAAILVSRLHMLPDEKIDREIAYLAIAVDKTAGENEKTAWAWLMDEIEAFRHRRRQGGAA